MVQRYSVENTNRTNGRSNWGSCAYVYKLYQGYLLVKGTTILCLKPTVRLHFIGVRLRHAISNQVYVFKHNSSIYRSAYAVSVISHIIINNFNNGYVTQSAVLLNIFRFKTPKTILTFFFRPKLLILYYVICTFWPL